MKNLNSKDSPHQEHIALSNRFNKVLKEFIDLKGVWPYAGDQVGAILYKFYNSPCRTIKNIPFTSTTFEQFKSSEIPYVILVENMLCKEQCIYNTYITEKFAWVNGHIVVPEIYNEAEIDLSFFVYDDIIDRSFGYTTVMNGLFSTTSLPIPNTPYNPINYNDDIPENKLKDFITSNSPGLCILHGAPGTGKSYYIRSLISRYQDMQFNIMNADLLGAVSSASFIDYLLGNRNTIFILEDCEELISVQHGRSSLLGTLLNLSDGLLGAALNIKFILTFNTDLKNIDPALLRKGRLKYKYEFKKLETQKVNILAKSLGLDIIFKEPMVLCDIYNYKEETGYKQTRKQIGFNN